MIEERRDNSIIVLGLLLAAMLAFYGLWTEGNPTVVEIVELVTNEVYEFLDPKIITRVDKQVIYMTATPGPSVDSIIYGTPIPQLTTKARADVVSTLRALTPVAPTQMSASTEVAQHLESGAGYLESGAGQAPTINVPTETAELMPTAAPAPPEVAQQAPIVAPEPPTALPTEPLPVVPIDTPVPPTVAPTNTPVPPTVAPTNTQVPPTLAPTNTTVPPTVAPTNTQVPPTIAPTNTPVPPTIAPTNTTVPPTAVPPTHIPSPQPTLKQLTPVVPTNTPAPSLALKPLTPVAPVLVPPELVQENPEQVGASGGMATLQGRIDFIDEENLTLILTNGDYFSSFDLASDGEFWFENVPNGAYTLSINGSSGGDTCAEITISVPEGHRTHTYNYSFRKMQCTQNF